MAYQTFAEYNQTGLAGLFTYPASILPIFIPLILFGLFCIVFMSSFFAQKRAATKGAFLNSFAASSYFVFVVAIVMSLVDNLINLQTLVVTLVISIVATLLLLLRGN